MNRLSMMIYAKEGNKTAKLKVNKYMLVHIFMHQSFEVILKQNIVHDDRKSRSNLISSQVKVHMISMRRSGA